MLEIHERFNVPDDAAALELVLPFELRQKSRLRTTTACGRDVGLFLERGTVLVDGDGLRADDGTLLRVRAAAETVSETSVEDPTRFARAAYHLGNRHVSLQVGTGWLRWPHDHVLDDMVRRLGLVVTVRQAPFQPEAGAYHSHGGHGRHSHDH